jgi:hypothetical protein
VSTISTPQSDRHTPSVWRSWHSASLLAILVVFIAVEVLAAPSQRFTAWLAIMALLILFALVAGHGVTGLWFGLLIDSRNKISLSRFQMLGWTIMILSSFLTAVMVNLDLRQDQPLAIVVPPELWLLMGITTTSMVGSPLILNLKKQRTTPEPVKNRAIQTLLRRNIDPEKVAIQGQIIVNQLPESARLGDLFSGSETGNVGQIDLGKLQMFFFTIILMLAYGASLAALFRLSDPVTALPILDAGMLTLLGISHAGYLANKALPRVGEQDR